VTLIHLISNGTVSYQYSCETNINESHERGKKKKLFSYIKSLRTDYCGVSTLQRNGVQYNENQDKANILNEYFPTVFTRSEHPCPNLGRSLYPDMPTFEISQDGVTHLLNDLDASKSHGLDKLPTKLLKFLSTALFNINICSLLTPRNCTSRLEESTLVAPLFKKGERSNPENYHPVSLTCVCSKILEHIIHTNIMKHLSNCHILSDVQFGFREHHSAEL